MKKIISLVALGLIYIISSISVQSQEQLLPPVNFKASVESNGNFSSVLIEFDANEHSITPDKYNIFYTYGEQEKLIKVTEIKYSPNLKHYKYFIEYLKPGVYNFFVTAGKYDENGKYFESERTEIITVRIGDFSKNIYFLSKPVTNGIVGEKYVYQVLVKTPLDCSIKLELLEGPDGMHFEDNYLVWEPNHTGKFNVTIKASLTECNINEHTIQQFTVYVVEREEYPYVKIKFEEKLVAHIGDMISARIQAESNVKCPIIFKFEGELPETFRWEKDGSFSFVPVHSGEYHISVMAYLECMPDIMDKFHFVIVVGEGDPNHKYCATISGSVYFDDQNPVPSGYVSAVKVDRNNDNSMPVFKAKINDGKFELNVPEGNYAIDIKGEMFYPEWYQDAEYITEAERITVKCDETKEITAYVKPLPVPEKYNVSGRVYDSETDDIVYAIVRFIPVQLIFNNHKENPNIPIFETRTKEDGTYEIILPDNYTYIAQAISAMDIKQYKIQYYNQVYSPHEADLITLTDNLEGIDFPMVEIKPERYGFSGQVFNENNEPLKAMLIAVCIHPKDKNAPDDFVQSTYTDEEGIYHFNGLIEGEYTVMSIPSDANYVPGYYNNNDFVVQKWQESKTIMVQENMIDMMFDFKHKQRGQLGLIVVNGKIFGRNGLMVKDEYTQESVPVPGAFVYGVNSFGQVTDFAFTNENGEFTLDELPDGDIKIVADKVGMNFSENSIKTDYEENPEVQMQIYLDNSTTSVIDYDNASITVYPIPASDFINIESENLNNAKVIIYDILGNKLVEKQSDSQKISIDISNLTNGSYLIKIENGTYSKSRLISVFR